MRNLLIIIFIFSIVINANAQTKSKCTVGNCDNGFGTYVWGDDSKYTGDKYTGYWKDGLREGQGTYTWANGEKYEGTFVGNRFSGTGTMLWNNGDKYVGEWSDSKRNGKGTYTYADGTIKKGVWKDNVYVDDAAIKSGCITGNCENGYGVYVWPNGEKYEGYWKNDKRGGQGTNYFLSGEKYVGEWKDDFRSGYGTNYYKDGSKKTGYWLNDKFQGTEKTTDSKGCISGDCDNGYGVWVFSSGEKYEGNWSNKVRKGKGVNYFISGAKYTGDWVNDKKEGQGTYEYANGDVYTGQFSNDSFNGQGILTFKDGDKYTGEFKDNLYHGKGTLVYKDGTKKSGYWKNNVFIGNNKNYNDNNDIDKSNKNNYTGSMIATGTGFAFSKLGYIATNYHVIDGGTTFKIRGINENYTKSFSAEIVIVDKVNDLAILKIKDEDFTSAGEIPFVITSKASDPGVGVFALGYPLRATMGEEIKLSNGIVSSKSGFKGDITTYQISVPVQPGNSGGPLFDDAGSLIGVISAKHSTAENVSYAIKSSYLVTLIESLPNPPVLTTVSNLEGKSLPEKVKLLRKVIYIIEVY